MNEHRELTAVFDTVSKVSWGAVIAGTTITIVVAVMLELLGLAIGLFSLDIATEQNPVSGYGIGAMIWWLLSWLVALFAGGWVTARFAGLQRVFDGALHGLVTWSLATILSFVLLTSVLGTVVGGAFGVVTSVFQATQQVVSMVVPAVGNIMKNQNAVETVVQEAQQMIQTVRQQGGDDAVNELTSAIREIFSDAQINQQEQQRIVNLLVKYTDMGRQDAQKMVSQWQNTYQQAREQIQSIAGDVNLEQRAEQLADTLAAAALWSFIGMLLGALAAGLGGATGRVKGNVRV